ncbi:alpha/beta hydrolase fold-domain-containing protein [Zopfochytrium polystomum]|nr:alpha/beta hydrolase fold-domain-containing protein [Zopfochytrium polystomum]
MAGDGKHAPESAFDRGASSRRLRRPLVLPAAVTTPTGSTARLRSVKSWFSRLSQRRFLSCCPATAAEASAPQPPSPLPTASLVTASNPVLDWLRKRFPGWFPPRRPEPSPAPDPFGWKQCNKDFFCGSLTVPVDHLNVSDGRVLSIAVIKSGVGFVKEAGKLTSFLTGGHHDILGFDPRGIGASNPVICYPSAAAHAAADVVPHSAGLLPHISTASTNRDMDLLRAALGDEKLNFWGFSYGSFLGVSYVNMFPDRVGSVVLDGVVDPAPYVTSVEDWTRGTLADTEAVLDGFGRECEAAAAAAASRCPLTRLLTAARPSVAALLRGALDDLDAAPVALSTGSVTPFLSGLHMAQAITVTLYSPTTWPAAADAFLRACWTPSQRDPLPLARLLGAVPEADDAGAYCPATDRSGSNGFLAVKCADGAVEATDGAEWERVARRGEEVSPLLGRAWAYVARPCAFWPRPVERYTGPWNRTLSNKVLLISNTLDPVTPLSNGKAVASVMTEANSVLLTQKGYGHCSLAQFSTFFTHGTPPEPGTVCEADGTPYDAGAAAAEGEPRIFSEEMRAQFEKAAAMVANANRVWK